MERFQIECMDCLEWMKKQPDKSIDLLLCSPPYEQARLYSEVQFKLRGQEYVDWCFERYMECYRITKGLVAWVVEGQTRQFRYSATPALLMADLHRAGVKLRKPPVFHRVGIPGSGGPDWLRNDWEWCICASHGKLPWSDPTAMGGVPRYGAGGVPSHRLSSGERANDAAMRRLMESSDISKRDAARQAGVRFKTTTSGLVDGNRTATVRTYVPPEITNPGNVIHCIVGGGLLGSKLAHLNEAPYPEKLAEFFIRSFCPPGGLVCDIFSGSGTTAAVALRLGRRFTGCDVRESQVELTKRRVAEIQTELVA